MHKCLKIFYSVEIVFASLCEGPFNDHCFKIRVRASFIVGLNIKTNWFVIKPFLFVFWRELSSFLGSVEVILGTFVVFLNTKKAIRDIE